jgi:heme/copper-type cytochrome/quinol oxidase subunit 3
MTQRPQVHGVTPPRYVEGTHDPATWGLALFITTEAIIFTLLFVSYWYVRSGSTAWPPVGDAPPKLLIPLINTAILLSSSGTAIWAERGIKRGSQGQLRLGMAITFALGLAFLALQLNEYANEELVLQSSAYASFFFVITGFHTTHVFVGLMMWAYVQLRAWCGHFNAGKHLAVTNVGWYWHFVDVIWLFVLAIVYISPHVAPVLP